MDFSMITRHMLHGICTNAAPEFVHFGGRVVSEDDLAFLRDDLEADVVALDLSDVVERVSGDRLHLIFPWGGSIDLLVAAKHPVVIIAGELSAVDQERLRVAETGLFPVGFGTDAGDFPCGSQEALPHE